MEGKKVITIGICLEGPQCETTKPSNLLSSIIQKEKNKIMVTKLKYDFIVSEYFKAEYIRVYLSYILNKHLQEMKSLKGNQTKDSLSARNKKTIDYFTHRLISDLKEFGFKYIENIFIQPEEVYYYSNAKTKENQEYVENFNSWYLPNIQAKNTKNI